MVQVAGGGTTNGLGFTVMIGAPVSGSAHSAACAGACWNKAAVAPRASAYDKTFGVFTERLLPVENLASLHHAALVLALLFLVILRWWHAVRLIAGRIEIDRIDGIGNIRVEHP